MKFCSECGSRVEETDRRRIDRAARYVCTSCKAVFYLSPRLVAACLAVRDSAVLLCKRAVPPAYGLWTLPCGFIDAGEPVSKAVLRETLEEAGVAVELQRPYALFHIPHVNQMQIVYLAEISGPLGGPGNESLETRLFPEQEIPWNQLAFVTTGVALRHYFGDVRSGRLGFHFADVMAL